MSEIATEAKKQRTETVYEEVKMEDGRSVSFPGKRRMDKTVIVNDDGSVSVRFDFRNGRSLSVSTADLEKDVILYACGHGLSQKCGDNVAGVEEVEDMVLGVEEMIAQLKSGKWGAERAAGDSTAGASVVIRAIVEAKAAEGKTITIQQVKDFLNGKLEAAKAAGQTLTRQALYNSFRNPATKTGQIVKRLEEEKLSKKSAVDSEALLGEI